MYACTYTDFNEDVSIIKYTHVAQYQTLVCVAIHDHKKDVTGQSMNVATYMLVPWL